MGYMEDFTIFLAVLCLIVHVSALYRSEICVTNVTGSVTPKSKNYLYGYKYEVYKSIGLFGCQKMCYRFTSCKSINYNKSHGYCELLMETLKESPQREYYKSGFLYLDKQDFNKNLETGCREKNCSEHTYCVTSTLSGLSCKIVRPHFQYRTPGSRYVHHNTSTKFTCTAYGINVSYSWYKSGNNTIIDDKDTNGVYVNNSIPGQLSLQVPGYSKTGSYSFVCHAKNKGGTRTATATVRVVDYPVIKVSKTTPALVGGTTLNLSCSAVNDLTPRAYWYKYDNDSEASVYLRSITSLSTYTNVTADLVFTNPTSQIIGTYFCRIKTWIDDEKAFISIVSDDLMWKFSLKNVRSGNLLTSVSGSSTWTWSRTSGDNFLIYSPSTEEVAGLTNESNGMPIFTWPGVRNEMSYLDTTFVSYALTCEDGECRVIICATTNLMKQCLFFGTKATMMYQEFSLRYLTQYRVVLTHINSSTAMCFNLSKTGGCIENILDESNINAIYWDIISDT